MTEQEEIKKNKELCKEFPFLVPRNWNDEIPENYDYSYTELIENGWKELQIEFFKEIKPLLERTNYLNEYKILDSKEKYGQWRLYSNRLPKEIFDEYNEILNKYVKISEHTCVYCGDRTAKMTYCGWIFPCCKKCWENNNWLNETPYKIATRRKEDE